MYSIYLVDVELLQFFKYLLLSIALIKVFKKSKYFNLLKYLVIMHSSYSHYNLMFINLISNDSLISRK